MNWRKQLLTEDQKREIAETLLGSCMLGMDLEDEYNCDGDEIELAASEQGIEMCASCGWWTDEWNQETGEIICLECDEE